MMTAKEKAKELVSKFTFLTYPESNSKFYNPKQCALIVVDELISDNEYNEEIVSGGLNKIYWQEVKLELEKL